MSKKNNKARAVGTVPTATPPSDIELINSPIEVAEEVQAPPRASDTLYVKNFSNSDAEGNLYIDDFLGKPLLFHGGVAVVADPREYGGRAAFERSIQAYAVQELQVLSLDPR